MSLELRRRARHLVKLLRELQTSDHPITAPLLIAAKHLLQHHCCRVITIKHPYQLDDFFFKTARVVLPRFIVSQLEEQVLTDPNDSEEILWPPHILFVCQNLANLRGGDRGYASLFRWYYPPDHRTYYFFAYIKFSMPRRTYTLSELLELRSSSDSRSIMSLTTNSELGTLSAQLCHC
jgi:hypothetical protein